MERPAQQVAAADQAIENLCEICIAFAALWFASGVTAAAAWRLISRPLGIVFKENYRNL